MKAAPEVLPPRYAGPCLIGRGGMGEIYLARDRELDRPVVVKMLAKHLADDPAVRKRFEREAATAARLSGEPHVVQIFDVGEWNLCPYIVMEHLAGGSVAARLAAGPVPLEDALSWLEQAGAGLDAAHRHGVVHRDVKPANLLFDEEGELHVADFGIARVLDEPATGTTVAGSVLGTAGYLSPEQARGEPATPASDVYALGVVAYELLTGRRPFARESAAAEAAAHVHAAVPRASAAAPRLPRAVDGVFDRVLAKEPSVRHATARELADALQRAFDPHQATTRLLAVPARRSRRRRLAAALAVAALGGALAAVLSSGSSGPVGSSVGEHMAQALLPSVPATTAAASAASVAVAPAAASVPIPPPTDARRCEKARDQLARAKEHRGKGKGHERQIEKSRAILDGCPGGDQGDEGD